MTWLGTFIIVFREAFEIILTLVLILAATNQLKNRKRWLTAGVFCGILGSVVVAYFTEGITEALEGMGQEAFQATILGVSALLIAYTVIWMQKNSALLVADVKKKSQEVVEGKRHICVLSSLIGLTVLRDGAEVVLLSQGFLASGTNAFKLLVGGVLGLLAGCLLGYIILKKITKINTKLIFQATAISLIFVAAGMVSQAIASLSSGGFISFFTKPIWDTSMIIPDKSIIGEFLHILFGYCSKPSTLQVLGHLITLAIVFLLWLRAKKYGKIGLSSLQTSQGLIVANLALCYFIF